MMNAAHAGLASIDAFMASPKRVLGADTALRWGLGFNSHERQIRYPLEVAGESSGSQLMIVCFPGERTLKFRLGILYDGMICRLDYTDETHLNSADGVVDHGLAPIITGPHYHSWSLNRRFFRGVTAPPRLHDAIPYHGGARTVDAVLRWFCTDTEIESLPANHRIELPSPTELFP
jgi:hypothetical protein